MRFDNLHINLFKLYIYDPCFNNMTLLAQVYHKVVKNQKLHLCTTGPQLVGIRQQYLYKVQDRIEKNKLRNNARAKREPSPPVTLLSCLNKLDIYFLPLHKGFDGNVIVDIVGKQGLKPILSVQNLVKITRKLCSE